MDIGSEDAAIDIIYCEDMQGFHHTENDKTLEIYWSRELVCYYSTQIKEWNNRDGRLMNAWAL